MRWKVLYYDDRVKKNILSWPKKLLAAYLKSAELLTVYGPDLGMPRVKALGKGLFEIRVEGDRQAGRVIYCYCRWRRIIVLHGFIKKSQKTPVKDLALARLRRKEFL